MNPIASALNPVPAIPDIPAAILEQAINWAVKLGSGTSDATAKAGFQRNIDHWRGANPLHEAVWLELMASEESFKALPRHPQAVALRTLEAMAQNRQVREARRKVLRLLGLATTGVAVGTLAASQMPWRDWVGGLGANYATGTGQRRTINLADGTQIKLNTDTAIDVRFTAARRQVLLRKGEIFINTGKDISNTTGRRPFWVNTAETHLEAIGTSFLVHQEPGRTRLRVTDGAVAIYGEETVIAGVDDEFLIGPMGRATPVPVTSTTFDPTGWTDGALVAKQMRLGDFVNELGRYRQGWMHCDPAVADLRVSGVFQIDDTDRALEALANALPIKIEFRTRYWVTLIPA